MNLRDPKYFPTISVIVPTLNEAGILPACLASIRANVSALETIVADGGSNDETRTIAEAAGAIVLSAPRGRGPQCRAGAQRATAQWLLFLHADTFLPPEASAAIARFTRDPAAQIATFRFRFTDGGFWLNAWTRLVFFDSVFTRFGDQGILVRRSFYETIGGFPAWPLFEDVALFQRARPRTFIHWLPAYVTTSARRFRQHGLLRQKWLNVQLLVRYLAGASPEELATRYNSGRDVSRERRDDKPAGP
ncbi:MAG: TIGR04283 family arsenosugar biosynthesis glycosyltransferase [Opitutaceae bacterium]|nr:TIGR04283 family arsenosugar biosynthesis glycosyltransferase [Opitutaceae bacterium]